MISDDVRKAVDDTLRAELSGIGFDRAEVAEDVDHDGEEVLRINIHYRKVGQSVDPTPTFSVTTKLRRALASIGEARFPHLKHLFPEDQELKVA